MAIDYALKFPCAARKNIPDEKLETLVGYMSLAQFAVGKIRQSDPNISMNEIEEIEVNWQQKRPDGVATQFPVKIGKLIDLAQPLGPFRAQCQDCRANIADRPFGCIAKINYPITKESESWLVSRLTQDASDPKIQMLFRFVSDLKIDGKGVDKLRDRLFELPQPVVRHWVISNGTRISLNSSQILHILAFGGDIDPKQAELYTRMLNLETVLKDPHPPSSNIEQFKTLMCGIVMAGRLNAQIGMNH